MIASFIQKAPGQFGLGRWGKVSLALFALLTMSGCVHEKVEGTTRTFTYETWVPLTGVLVCVGATVMGWFLRDKSATFGWGFLLVAPVLLVLFVPSLFLDKAVVDETGLSLNTGIWGRTAVHNVRFDNIRQIRYVMEESRGRRGRKRENYYLICDGKDGSSNKIPLGNAVAEAAAEPFILKARDLGIPLIDQT